MNLSQFRDVIAQGIKKNSPIILSTAASVGVISTTYLAGRASFKAAEVIRESEETHGYATNPRERLKIRVKLVWKLYIPTAVSAASTVICIAGANRVGAAKTLAAQTAFAVTERAYSEYRDKVVEEFGERKDQAIRDKIAADRVSDNPPSKSVVISGAGHQLFCEMHTGRYFMNVMETVRRAEIAINKRINDHDYATLDDFYYLVGLKPTTTSGNLGWTAGRHLELYFSTHMTDDERAAITFEYNYIKPL